MVKRDISAELLAMQKKTTVNGIKFDSKLEADKYIHLLTLEKVGKIKDLKTQVPFELLVKQDRKDNDIVYSLGKRKQIAPIKYVTDFVYTRCSDNQLVALDTKGRQTEVYKIKLKFFLACYPSYQFIECYRDSKKNNFNIY